MTPKNTTTNMAEEKWSTQKIKSRIEENELDLSLCGISKVPVLNLVMLSIIFFICCYHFKVHQICMI